MTPASRSTLKWCVQVDFVTGTSMLAHVCAWSEARAATIFSRTGSLSACSTALSSRSSRAGWAIFSAVSVVVMALYDDHRTLIRYDDNRTTPPDPGVRMKDERVKEAADRARARRRSAGLVAQYIHELSQRHAVARD